MKGLLVAVLLAVGGAVMADHDALVTEGERLFVDQGCYGCHTIGAFGTPIGPDLSHLGSKYPEDYLQRWLRDPEAQRPTAHMPKLELKGVEVRALAAYLASLK